MNHHAGVAQGDQAVGLVAVGEERAGHGLAHQQPDHRVPGQTGPSVAVDRGGQGLMDAEGFFATAIGLARHIDDGDQRALVAGRNGFIHGFGQPPAFEQADFAIACAGEAVLRVGDHGDKAHLVFTQYAIGDFQRVRQPFHGLGAGTQRVEPLQASHERSP